VSADFAEQDDRDVVDRGATVGRALRDGSRIRPQDAERDLVEGQAIPRDEDPVRGAPGGEDRLQRRVPWPRPDHPGLQHPTDDVPLEERRQPGGVVLVRVGQDHQVDPSVPWRQSFVQRDQQPPGVRAAVHEHSPTATALDQDRVPLADIEDDHPCHPVRSMNHDDPGREDGGGQRNGQQPRGPGADPVRERPAAFRGRARLGVSRRIRHLRRRRRLSSPPPERHQSEAGCRDAPTDQIPRRVEGHAREGQRRPGPDQPDDRREEGPGREAEHRWNGRDPREADEAAEEGDYPGRHRGCHQRHDPEVHDRRDER